MKVLEKPKQFWESAKLEDSQQLISKYSKVIILNRALFCTPRERKYSAVPRDVLVLIFGSLLLVKARDNVKHLQQLFMIVSNKEFSSVQFSSVAQSCPTICDPMDYSMTGFPVHHQLLEPTQTHVLWVSDIIQPSHSLPSPSLPAFNLSQHQGLFQWVSSLHQVETVLALQLNHHSLQWILRIGFL